ncbi:hypothetical protein RJ55_05837 [Drechmeria coniospora]|nr:hypothetical protein RJ55_05837 [Drechmeria coniospora]
MDTVAQESLFNSQVKALPFDRALGNGKEAVLFTDPTSPTFAEFHNILSKAARASALTYRVRYRRNYIVIDDRETGSDSAQGNLGSEKVFSDFEEAAELRPLSTTELSTLGMKTASFIRGSNDPFDTLLKLTQDFPRFAASIAAQNVSKEFANEVILWLNDLENDVRYKQYPKTLISLLQRTYPGQMPPIGRDVFNIVVPSDFTNAEDLAFVSQIVPIVERGIPIRFGLVPLTPAPGATSRAKVLYYLNELYGPHAVINCIEQWRGKDSTDADATVLHNVVAAQESLSKTKPLSLAELLKAESYAERTKLAARWVERLDADTPTRPLFINGIVTPRDENWMQSMSVKIGEDLQAIQKRIFEGVLDEDTWVAGVFLDGATATRNKYIVLENDKALRMLDVGKIYNDHAGLFSQFAALPPSSELTMENWAVVTVFSDLETSDGLELALMALEFKRNNPGIHLELAHNPQDPSTASQINAALRSATELLISAEEESLREIVAAGKGHVSQEDHSAALSAFLAVSKIGSGTKTILVNGRIVGPIASGALFTAENFQQLLEFEQRHRIMPVYTAISNMGLTDKLSDAISAAKLTSMTALSTISDLPDGIFDSASATRSTMYSSWSSLHSGIELGNSETANIHLVCLLDPVSEKGQRWGPIIRVLSELEGVYVKILLNPQGHITELPVKRFFRYVMESKPFFDERGKVAEHRATFKGLPLEALLTTAMDVPPAWLVAPKVSVHDLDNIKLSSIENDVEATYELQNILIEGHSREGQGTPPRGAQLVLATEKDPLLTDTIVMSNLGFFQFKANPGFYNIQLKEGRTVDIYTIESIGAQGWGAVPGDEGTELALMDFQGKTLYPRLKRRPGMEHEDVLEKNDNSPDSFVSKGLKFAEGLFGNSKRSALSGQEHSEINIFSVASGHLYERMLNIMMVSVMRNTNRSVKFWFIEQFLSPSFKELIPHLAKEYGFKYEMVTYKWPHWLRQQKEKQREIWGYKILFLDVLFPLSLDKVIFVDADQIVRTDMMDLVTLDLEGAPYGFTPMCDSRTEMEGFRFWKQGYWARYLRGRPYHISALYVVDLHRFRELAAGDRLRQQYHALSADPGSLSNLDQDLPNHMQFQIPIHSLPQEWLWCETWCSDESLENARTIDLCNNPQTKEPKLDRAKRQVPEWTVYDDEIAALDMRRREQKNKGKTDHLTASSATQLEADIKSQTSEEGDARDDAHNMDEL